MAAKPRKMSEIVLEMAQVLLRHPSEVPTSGAMEAALFLANVAWNECVGLDHPREGYLNVLNMFESECPGLWKELKSNDINALIDELVRFKQEHYPEDGRRIVACGVAEGKVHVEWVPPAAPGSDSRTEMQLYGMIRAGQSEQAIRFLQATQGISRDQAMKRLAAIAKELGR